MKPNSAVIDGLNNALGDELAAIGQYMVQAEMNAQWGYTRLHDAIQARAKDEMHHAEMLISRILFLGGTPLLTKPSPIHIGANVKEQIEVDLADEYSAFELYNKLAGLAANENDKGSEELFTSILHDEESHISTLESQAAQIQQMGLENFLANQTV